MNTHTKTYTVTPINTVKDIQKHFDWTYDWITPGHFPLKKEKGNKDVELIQLDKWYSTEDAIKKLDEMGYIPASSNYLLGLGVQYPEVHREKKWIVALDKQNIFASGHGDPCFLCLHWYGRRELYVADEAGDWYGHWWFCCVRKSPSETLPEEGDTLSLSALALRLAKVEKFIEGIKNL